jgi:hypothetical protein
MRSNQLKLSAVAILAMAAQPVLANIITFNTPLTRTAANNNVPPPPLGVTVQTGDFSNHVKTESAQGEYNVNVNMFGGTFRNYIDSTNPLAGPYASNSTETWSGQLFIAPAPGQTAGTTTVNVTSTGTFNGGIEHGIGSTVLSQITGVGASEVTGTMTLNDGVNVRTFSINPLGAGSSVGNGVEAGGVFGATSNSSAGALRVGVPISVTVQLNINNEVTGIAGAQGELNGFKLNVKDDTGLTAGKSIVAFVENGGYAWEGHNNLTGLVAAQSAIGIAPGYSDHATETASCFYQNGTALGLDAGQASRAIWRMWGMRTDTGADVATAVLQAAPSVRIINISRGTGASSAGTDAASVAVDKASYLYRNLVTIAINEANPRPAVSSPDGAFNGLSVGATGQAVETAADPNFFRGHAIGSNLATFTGIGPTSDGRAKPDIVGPGTNVRMSAYVPAAPALPGSDPNLVKTASGTSFSAPYVAGVAASLIDAGAARGFNTDPLTIKAVLMNSAQEVRGDAWDGWSPASTNVPLDKDQGAGEVSTPRAHIQYERNPEQNPGTVLPLGWDFDTVNGVDARRNYFIGDTLAAGSIFTATLDWFREMTLTATLGLDNLDLELWKTDGTNLLNRVTLSNSALDDVEHIHRFLLPDTAKYALSVKMITDPTANGADAYGLAWMVVPEPATLGLLTLAAPALLMRARRRRA